MGWLDKNKESDAEKLKQAQAEIKRLQAELEATQKTAAQETAQLRTELEGARTEIKTLQTSRGLGNLDKIISHFQGEVSKLAPYADKAIVYRYRVLICAVNDLLIPLAQTSGNDNAVETLKQIHNILPKDFAELVNARQLLRATTKPEEIKATLKSYFDLVPGAERILQKDIEKAIQFKQAKIYLDETKQFAQKLNDYFVKTYHNVKQNPDAKVWLETILNIGTITADWTDHILTGVDPLYCYNYRRMMNDFNNEKDSSFDYKLNDYAKSTDYSNFVHEEIVQKLVNTFGIDRNKLGFIIDNYRVNGDFVPNSTQQNFNQFNNDNQR
ncbi:MAG: hypothetical protein IKP05_03610 [Alphaproteobacteria bacterium]|nr:hypothetical protein [Alphaproteobacteria bacterium]